MRQEGHFIPSHLLGPAVLTSPVRRDRYVLSSGVELTGFIAAALALS
jgi:hypothetical protein